MKKRKLPFWCSCVVMGSGQLMYRQWIKGLLYLGCLALYLYYLFTSGITDIIGFFTLGTVEGDPWLGIQGDDSILMLLRGRTASCAVGESSNPMMRKSSGRQPYFRNRRLSIIFAVTSLLQKIPFFFPSWLLQMQFNACSENWYIIWYEKIESRKKASWAIPFF